jgi:DNA-cytosine methyltransferase
MQYNHIDLFSGTGGFSLGLEKSGIVTTQFVEYEEHLQRVLKKHWPNVNIHKDIKDYEAPKQPFIITGGFPCSDISIANPTGKGLAGERSGLWREYLRVIRNSKPKYVLIENVFALLSKGLGTIIQDLAESGYDSTWTIIDSQYCGVPQRRRRVYILGVRDGIPRGADPLANSVRSGQEMRPKINSIKQGFKWNFEPQSNSEEPIAFFTRQRSDEFAQKGVASTILKRDYKDFTDLVLYNNNIIRKLSIYERLRLQGIPEYWLDDCGLTNQQKYMANGMTIAVTKWLGEKVMEFDKSINKP